MKFSKFSGILTVSCILVFVHGISESLCLLAKLRDSMKFKLNKSSNALALLQTLQILFGTVERGHYIVLVN